jgi:membrane-associated phospholipid phosphatase
LPTAGAYSYYLPKPGSFSNFNAQAGMWHYELLNYFRGDSAPILDFEAIHGLIFFPSFHTILAVLTPYSVRHWKYLFAPAVILNVLVIISTLPEGGHHLIDVLAGAAIAAAAIVGLRKLPDFGRSQPAHIQV